MRAGDVEVRRLSSSDRPWLVDTLNHAFAGVIAARRGATVDVLPVFSALWGMDLCALHRHGVARARALKPSIPPHGADGIPLEHELEFELLLPPGGAPASLR